MNYLKKCSIKVQLMFLAVSTVIVFSIIFLLVYFRFENLITKKNDVYTRQLMVQISNSVTEDYKILKRILFNIEYNSDVQHYLLEENSLKKYELYEKARKSAIDIKNLKDGISEIVIVDNKGDSLEIANGANYINEMRQGAYDERQIYISGMLKYNYWNYSKNCFIVRTDIYSVIPGESNDKVVGLLFLFVDVENFSGNISTISGSVNTYIYLIDRNNIIYSSNSPDKVGDKFDISAYKKQNGFYYTDNKGMEYIIQDETIPYIDGKIICIAPRKELLSDATEIRRMEFIIFLVSILLLAIPFVYILKNILNPIGTVLSHIDEIKAGNLKNFKKRIAVEGYTEMKIMIERFNSMMEEIDELTHRLLDTNTRLYETEIQKNRSELAYLKSQINPHFLYNTLEAIKGMAIEKELPEITAMTKALGNVFRYSAKGKDFVTLKEEMDIVKSYIKIQLIRFGDRFAVSYELSEDALVCQVPKMILQPVIENSILHGLEPKKEGGLLVIGTKIDGKRQLVISIHDNGTGIDPSELEKINASLSGTPCLNRLEGSSRVGIGLINVSNRIRLIYGLSYGICIDSSVGNGTKVIIRIPVMEADLNVQDHPC